MCQCPHSTIRPVGSTWASVWPTKPQATAYALSHLRESAKKTTASSEVRPDIPLFATLRSSVDYRFRPRRVRSSSEQRLLFLPGKLEPLHKCQCELSLRGARVGPSAALEGSSRPLPSVETRTWSVRRTTWPPFRSAFQTRKSTTAWLTSTSPKWERCDSLQKTLSFC